MSDAPSGSTPGPSKAIGSLAKKPEVTRQGTQKLKFTPTLPVRRKKEEVKVEPVVHQLTDGSERGRGRGRGTRGDTRGRGEGGRGRGRGAPRPPVEMTASGPFAMGPALAGNNARRVAPRSNFVPIPGSGSAAALGAGLSRTAAPTLKREATDAEVDEEAYSDPDDGVQIVDMENVRQMDWMAPESLVKDRSSSKMNKIKSEESAKGKGKAKAGDVDVDEDIPAAAGDVNLANALNLSDSEEEEELEDLIDDFALDASIELEPDVRQERLYFFQFPAPFPTFASTLPSTDMDAEAAESEPTAAKKVSFAPGTKQAAAAPQPEKQIPKVDGIIGQMEIYKSGAVKMRLANGILLDVTAATQPSFLQQAVHLDMPNKQLNIIGEVNKRFVVSPNIDALIAAMDAADKAPTPIVEGEEGLIQMDME